MTNIKLVLNGNISIFDDNNKSYKSLIQEISNESILINIPCGEGEYYYLEEEKEYEMNYYNGSMYYIFNTTLIGKEKESNNNMPLYRIKYPYNVKKIQRRDFVRVDFIDYLKYRRIENDNNSWKDGMILDMSGGGLRVTTNEVLNEDDVVILKLNISDEEIELEGKIVRDIGSGAKGKIYGVEFIDISEGKRDKIIREVFKQMRKQKDRI